jgi:hypothetical protein
MRLEVYQTVAQQLMIENDTGVALEVLDDRGVPFIRIGPAGAEGNFGAPAWYLAVNPGTVVPANLRSASEARWRQVAAQPALAWFDSRLDTSHARLTPEILARAATADVGRWEIPVRVDGQAQTLRGTFRYEPPTGAYHSRLTSPREVAPGVQVTLLPGRAPGLMLSNSSALNVVVYGEHGEPFLRIGPNGVDANVNSATWWSSARSARPQPSTFDPAARPQWNKVAPMPRFSWIEPRAADAPGVGAPAQIERHWTVPLQVGDESVQVTGVGAWRPF